MKREQSASASARTAPLPIRSRPQQLQLAIGFYLEPQQRTQHRRVAASEVLAANRTVLAPKLAPAPVAPIRQIVSVAEASKLVERDTKPVIQFTEPAGCTCGAFIQWQIHPTSGELFCDPCGRWQGWEEFEAAVPTALRGVKFRNELRRNEAPSAPSNPSSKPKPVRAKKDPQWWASDEWKRANDQIVNGAVDSNHVPMPAEWTMAMQLETGVGKQGSRGAMHAHAAREAKRKEQAYLTTFAKAKRFIGWPVIVTLTRVSPIEFDDDNLGTAFKRIRDGICAGLGFKDDRKRPGYLDWQLRQEKGGSRKSVKGPAYHEVKVRIEVMR